MNARRERKALGSLLASALVGMVVSLAWSVPAHASGIHYDEKARRIEVGTGTDLTLATIAAYVPREALQQTDVQKHIWLLSANLLITNGTRLRLHGSAIGGVVDELRLKSDNHPGPNAFVSITADWGTIDIRSTRITSWDTERRGPDLEYADFGRAFVRARSRLLQRRNIPLQSRMDVVDSEIRALGYGANESYGLVWKVVAPENYLYDVVHVYGDVLRSRIRGNFFGLYSSGLRDAQWKGNRVTQSAEYGIAPHNHSNDLVIEDNEVYDNGNHGITVRQDCSRVWVRNNRVWGNSESGIALHRHITNSSVTGNTVQRNRDSGIVLYGASGIAVRANRVIANGIAGIQLLMATSNSQVEGNEITGNGQFGVFVGRGKGGVGDDNMPRGNVVADNLVWGSGEEEVRTGAAEYNRFARNTRVSAASP